MKRRNKMKKTINVIMILLVFLSSNFLISKGTILNLGIRYIKLAMSYREAHDYDNAFKYLKESQAIIYKYQNIEAKYWKAAIQENLAYTYKDIGLYEEAQKYLDSAINQYKIIIAQPDGSPIPLQLLKENMSNLTFSKEQFKAFTKSDITTINYDNQKLKELPNNTANNVVNLSVSNNRFTDIPAQLINFKDLKYVNLANNKIKSVKLDFSRLPILQWLDLSGNKIRTIDESIAYLKNLNFLDLSNNALKTLPAGLCNLKNLKVLNLKKNKIPFEQIAQLIKCLPNTNILYDTYIRKGDEIEE
jgi:Leucine-rich repeat (LRR) protein